MIIVGHLLNLLGKFIQKRLKVPLLFAEVGTKKNLPEVPRKFTTRLSYQTLEVQEFGRI